MDKARKCYRCEATNEAGDFYSNGYCRPCGAAYYADWRRKHPDRSKLAHRTYYLKHQERRQTESVVESRQLKVAALEAYGTACTCCGEAHIEFLAIDHIDGNGAAHRKAPGGPGGGGVRMYRWLKLQGYPPGYRTLCHNCNVALGLIGYCPHQEPDRDFMDPATRRRRLTTT